MKDVCIIELLINCGSYPGTACIQASHARVTSGIVLMQALSKRLAEDPITCFVNIHIVFSVNIFQSSTYVFRIEYTVPQNITSFVKTVWPVPLLFPHGVF